MESLTIVIPALNEEEAIGDTISRCLAARDQICAAANLKAVEIIVVSDGSTDRTASIARGFDEVTVIEFPTNRGYGAAIKEGFAIGSGSLVGFLDADGTCDPLFFRQLCSAVQSSGIDVALGSRLGPDSQMPTVRRIGNRGYAIILGFLCGQSVQDTASGMRVIRRTALPDLYPLPNGLHFTPAMSARALLSGIRIAELPMPYAERVGESKLHVFRDGVRFLKTILHGVLCFRPEKLFMLAFVMCMAIAALLAAYPFEFYLRESRLEEWMIYRFIVCFLLGAAAFVLISAGTLAHKLVVSDPRRSIASRFWPGVIERLYSGWPLAIFVGACAVASTVLIWQGVVELVSTGKLTLHWSRVLVAAFCMLVGFIACVTAVLLQVVAARQRQEHEDEARFRFQLRPTLGKQAVDRNTQMSAMC